MDPNGKKEKRPAKDHPAGISDERAGVVGSLQGMKRRRKLRTG